jgi:hypothetical protein
VTRRREDEVGFVQAALHVFVGGQSDAHVGIQPVAATRDAEERGIATRQQDAEVPGAERPLERGQKAGLLGQRIRHRYPLGDRARPVCRRGADVRHGDGCHLKAGIGEPPGHGQSRPRLAVGDQHPFLAHGV